MKQPSTRKALVVCGPTAAGKSALADSLAESLSRAYDAWVTTIVIDSMQVYKEVPAITNQARTRPAEMVGIVSVSEEWTVARHKERAEQIIDCSRKEVPFVLDAGTGMYLNTLILDVPLSPKVSPEVRAEAARLAAGADNPRREARREELRLIGAPPRRSIWDGELRYDVALLYLRLSREDLDHNIQLRSSKIVREGAGEAEMLKESSTDLNPSVREAVGIKEMLLYVSGSISGDEAREKISTRTRQLARRQMRWFDKLARTLPESSPALVVENTPNLKIKHFMHDIMSV